MKPKPQPQPLTPSDGSPMYQAIGCLYGQLQFTNKGAAIATPDGQRYKVLRIREQRLMLHLLVKTEDWQGVDLHWLVYPGGHGFTLVGFSTEPYPDLEPGAFKLQGHCKALADGAIGCLVKRNDPRFKEYTITTIQGTLPGLVDGELWRLSCMAVDGGLGLVHGEKLMDAGTPKKVASRGSSSNGPAPTLKARSGRWKTVEVTAQPSTSTGDRPTVADPIARPRKPPAFERR